MNQSEIIAKLRELADEIEGGSKVVTAIELTTLLNGNYERIDFSTQTINKPFKIEDQD